MIYKKRTAAAAAQIATFLFVLSAASPACTSAQLKSTGDLRAREYQELKQNIAEVHDASIFGSSERWLFADQDTDSYYQDFSRRYCEGGSPDGKPITPAFCEEWFSGVVDAMLSQTYFAADPAMVEAKCSFEPLVCSDLQTAEAMYRDLHNQSVQQSKKEKLAKIEAWKLNRLTDEELEAALHIKLDFADGQVGFVPPGSQVKVSRNEEKATP